MLDVSLFRILRFSAASGSIMVIFFALAGFVFMITQYFQFLKGYAPLSTGVRLLPVAICIAIGSVVGVRVAVDVGSRPLSPRVRSWSASPSPGCPPTARTPLGPVQRPRTRRTRSHASRPHAYTWNYGWTRRPSMTSMRTGRA
jgi:hypothetical protein